MNSPRNLRSALIGMAIGATAVFGADVLTQHNNNARTGVVLDETVLTTANVSQARFGRLWNLYVDGQVVAQPLYVSKLAIDTSSNTGAPLVQGTFNAVVLATMHNTVYVYDADNENPGPDGRTKPLWARWLNVPRPGGKDIDMWSTNDPEWGILSTPVISPDRSTLYVVAWHGEGPGDFKFKLHALELKSGRYLQPPAIIGVPSTDPSNPCRGQSLFNPCNHKQRPALLLHNNVIYIGFGGDGNRGALHAYNAQTLQQIAVWTPTPTGRDGGLWQSGQGPAADAEGNVYLSTGNGTFDAHTGGQNYGDSIVKLKLENNQFVVKDFFTPCNERFLNGDDLDLGSSGPVLLPVNPPKIVTGGKEGVLYLLQQNNLGKHIASNAPADCPNAASVQGFLAFPPAVHGNQTHYGNIHGGPVYWKGPDAERVYVWGENSTLNAYRFSGGKLIDTATPRKSAYRPPDGMPGGMLSLTANGNRAGSGIVWAVVPLDGDANKERGVKGIVLALDAQDVSKTLWTSEQFAQRDRLGLFAKFTSPTIANGKVFVATYGSDEPRRIYGPPAAHPTQFPAQYYIAVYGVLPAPPATIVNQNKEDVFVVKATTGPLALNAGQCQAIGPASVDCTDALATAAQAPSFHRVIVAANTNLASCSWIRVTTASSNGALNTAKGIGFWSAAVLGGNQAAENSGLYIEKQKFKAAGAATLTNGSPATLHEFVGLASCPGAGAEPAGRLFKPFMQFEGADGKIYRNWEPAANFRIDTGIPQFDRSGDVLRP